MSDIPSELLSIIFFHLRAELLYPLRYVCKAWCSLINDPYFIKTHTAKWINQDDFSNIHLLHIDKKGQPPVLCLNSYNCDDPNSLQFKSQIIPPKLWSCGSEIFTCNGLILIYQTNCWMTRSWSIINPLTLKVHHLPPLDEKSLELKRMAIGFGYDSATDDYKVVTHSSFFVDQKFGTFIYSLKSNSWKPIKNDSYRIPFKGTVFCNGALHWIGTRRGEDTDTIVAFDLGREDIRYVSLGKLRFSENHLVLGELGGSLSLIKYRFTGLISEIYIMGSYGDENSWSELYSQSSKDVLRPISCSATKEFLLLLNESIINQFILVNIKTKNTVAALEIPNTHPNIYCPQLFRPSLVRIMTQGANNKRKRETEVEPENSRNEETRGN